MSTSQAVPTAVLDANVLFPMGLCDTLMRAALDSLYTAHWNRTILDEIERNLVMQGRTTPEGARRRCLNMQRALPDALITGYENLVPTMMNNQKDRHVLATAVHIRAQIIVTNNIRHFPSAALAPYGIEAQSADTFLNSLFIADPDAIERIIAEQADRLTSPPQSVEQVLDNLALEAPIFADAVRGQLRRR
jgi:predicted nucleic acid-binding protein